jgi:TRAP-type C4-dicarboxylate transport system substrate-binding protein
MKRNTGLVGISIFILVWALLAAGPAVAKMRLKVSHQFAEGDVRDQMCRVFGDRVSEKTGGEIGFRYYPAKSLYKPKEQWDPLRQGVLDMSLYPLDYASGKVPQFSVTLMPCAVDSIKKAMEWRNKPIGKRIEQITEENGVKILMWFWLDGGIGSTERQIVLPKDVEGLKMRAAGKKFEYMLKEAGASITSMPSSEIYQALSTGVLNACLTSTASFVSYRLYEQLKFMNAPEEYSIWYMLEPLVISMKTWNKLTPEQQKVFQDVAEDMQKNWIPPKNKESTRKMIDVYKDANVDMHSMTKEEFGVWLDLAKKTAWKNFEETVPNGKELLDLALQAMD